MAKDSKGSWWSQSHRWLVNVEVILAIGALHNQISGLVLEWHSIHKAWRVFLVMALTVGLFGWALYYLDHHTGRTIKGTHDLLGKKIGAPAIVVHALLLIALFVLYAWQHNLYPFW